MRNYIILVLLLLAACRKSSPGGGTLNPNISILPSSGLPGTWVKITGNGFGTDTGAIRVAFNGTPAVIQRLTDTQLLVTVPTGTTGAITITKGSQTVKGPVYTYQSLSISGISPEEGSVGTIDSIFGKGLSFSGPGESVQPAVFFNGKPGKIISANDTLLVAVVPDTAGVGPISVSIGALNATGPVFQYLGIVSVTPLTGNTATLVTIKGGFGPDYNSSAVTLNGKMAVVVNRSQTSIQFIVPAADTTGLIRVLLGGQTITGPVFTYVPAPSISSIAPSSGPAGTRVTVTGTNFSSVASQDTLYFNGIAAQAISATATQFVVLSPAGAASGAVAIGVNGQSSGNGPVYKFQSLGVAAINPAQSYPPFQMTISGFGFGTVPGNVMVTINGINCPVISIVDTQLVVNVPASATSGNVMVKVGGLTASGPFFSKAGVITLAGGTQGLANGTGASAQFMTPAGMAIDAAGNLYVCDAGANNIRKITPDGTVSNFAGDPGGSSGYTDGQGSGARFNQPEGLAIDAGGNLYVADFNNGVIRKITAAGNVSTFVSTGTLINPWGMAVDVHGNIFASDYGVSHPTGPVFEFSSAGTLINTTPVNDGPVPDYPNLESLSLDNMGHFYVIDYDGDGIFQNVSPWFGGSNFSNNSNKGLTLDNNGNLVIADGGWNLIESLNPQTLSLTVIAGGGGAGGTTAGYQDGGLASSLFNSPAFVLVDAQGAIYISDQGNYAVRKIVLQ